MSPRSNASTSWRIGEEATCAITEMMPTAADRQERQEQAIITRIPGEAGALLLFDGGGEVAGRVLDGFDMLKLGKTVICFDADFQSGTAGHVIYDDRPLGHGIDGLVMADHAVLAGARVVRHNHEHRVGSRLLRLLDHAHGVRGIVRAGTGDHRDVHDFLDGPHQLDLLLHVGHGGFAGRAVHHQPVGAVGDNCFARDCAASKSTVPSLSWG